MSNLMCAETHRSQEKTILRIPPRKREAKNPESGMSTGLMAITSIPQDQDVQDVKTSGITAYLVITGYTVILSRKPSTKLEESTWFVHLCVMLNGTGLCCSRVLPAGLAPLLGLFLGFSVV